MHRLQTEGFTPDSRICKLAPPERVADYLSVHTCFTGVRGLLAPLLGFTLVGHSSMATMGWFAAALILGGTRVLVPEAMRGGLARRRAAPLTQLAPVDEGEP